MQLTLVADGVVTVQEIDPAGVNVEVPLTTTLRVVLPPRVAAL